MEQLGLTSWWVSTLLHWILTRNRQDTRMNRWRKGKQQKQKQEKKEKRCRCKKVTEYSPNICSSAPCMKPSATRPTHQFQRAKFSGGTTEIKLFTGEESYNWKQKQPQAYSLLLALQLPGLAADAITKLQVKKKKGNQTSVSSSLIWFWLVSPCCYRSIHLTVINMQLHKAKRLCNFKE